METSTVLIIYSITTIFFNIKVIESDFDTDCAEQLQEGYSDTMLNSIQFGYLLVLDGIQ